MKPSAPPRFQAWRRGQALVYALMLSTSLMGAAQAGYHLVSTIKVGDEGGWDYLEPDPVSRRLFVTLAIDARTMKVVGTYFLAPYTGSTGLAMDTQTRRPIVGTQFESCASMHRSREWHCCRRYAEACCSACGGAEGSHLWTKVTASACLPIRKLHRGVN